MENLIPGTLFYHKNPSRHDCISSKEYTCVLAGEEATIEVYENVLGSKMKNPAARKAE